MTGQTKPEMENFEWLDFTADTMETNKEHHKPCLNIPIVISIPHMKWLW